MGYYDFNDHFWSPREVCAQAPQKQPQTERFGFLKLMSLIFGAFFRAS